MRNQIGRHWLLIVLIAIAIFVGSTSCQRDSDVPKETNVENPKPQPVKVVLAQNPVPHSALPIIAKKKGFFEQEGLDVDVAEFTTGKLCFDAMLGGGADFSTVAETPLMYAGFSDQPVRIVATIVTSSETLKIVARKDAGVAKPSDLRGKPVGTFKGGNAEFFLAKFLKKHGLDLTDVKAIYMQPPELITAISRGDLAAISMWEPHAYNAAKALGDNAIVFSDNDLYVETFNIAVKSEFAETRGPVIEKFLRALLKAEKLLKNDPEAAKEIPRQYHVDSEGRTRSRLAIFPVRALVG